MFVGDVKSLDSVHRKKGQHSCHYERVDVKKEQVIATDHTNTYVNHVMDILYSVIHIFAVFQLRELFFCVQKFKN